MIEYRDAQSGDAVAIAAMGRVIFAETFAHEYDAEPFAAYVERAYGPDLARDLADPAVRYRLAIEDGAVVGYAKLSPLTLPADDPQPGAMELRQLYVRRDWHGSGIAPTLMDWTLAEARAGGAPELYLAVFDFNHRAKAFYARYGFAEVGAFDFRIGNRVDRDRIWRLTL